MPDAIELAHAFVESLGAGNAEALETVMHPDATLRVWGWELSEAYRPRARVVGRLSEEWAGWPDPSLEIFGVVGGGDRAGVEFRIQTTEAGRFVEHNRAAFLRVKDGLVHALDLYCAEPLPSARRDEWMAPATLSDDEMRRVIEMGRYVDDARHWVEPDESFRLSRQLGWGGGGDAHPGGNFVGGARWAPAEADARIEATIDWHRQRGIGCLWWVSPTDTPPDLPARLESHGLALAGQVMMMARVGLDSLDDIPVNTGVTVEVVDGTDEAVVEAAIQVTAVCFHMTPEQVARSRPQWHERLRDPKLSREQALFLARLDGEPVATGRVVMRAGLAHLVGAGTLPSFRGRRIYSTLLRRRLEAARGRGYQIAVIDAGPMSRRVVEKYGFRYLGTSHILAWMPVMDPAVIRTLVPDE